VQHIVVPLPQQAAEHGVVRQKAALAAGQLVKPDAQLLQPRGKHAVQQLGGHNVDLQLRQVRVGIDAGQKRLDTAGLPALAEAAYPFHPPLAPFRL
jgi:hypothetical protein